MMPKFEMAKQADKSAKKEISEQEYKERLERLSSMAKVIGQDFDMAVEVGKQPGWRYIFKPVNKIEVDPRDIREKGLDYCFGVISHEGAHRKISRTDFIPKDIWQETGFSFLMNAIEDPRVNNWIMRKYDGCRDWLESVYNQDLSAEDNIEAKAKAKMGYTPKHIKYGLEIIRYWHLGQFSENLDPQVAEALDQTREYAQMAYETLPAIKNPEEQDIKEKAELVYKIVYSVIWPVYEKLIDEAVEEEKLNQMLKDMAEKGDLQVPDDAFDQDKQLLPLDSLPKDLQEELKKKIKEKLQSMGDEEREKYEQEMEQAAEEALDDLEDKINQELKGELAPQPESKKEEAERKAREQAEKKQKAELKKQREKAEKEIKEQRSEYDKAYAEVAPYIDSVAEDILNIFLQKRFPQFKRSFPGQKLRLKGAMSWEGQKQYRDLFETRLPQERQEFRFFLLVDLSGSMSGEKIEETFKGVVLFCEALQRVGEIIGNVDVAVYGFQDVLIEYKKFGQQISDNLRDKMSVMKREVSNHGYHNASSYNNDGYCLQQASEILDQESGDKFLIVLSDGEPAGDDIHRVPKYKDLDQKEELIKVVADISKETEQHLLAIGLGAGTGHVATYYKESLERVENMPNVDIKKLAGDLGAKLKKLVS